MPTLRSVTEFVDGREVIRSRKRHNVEAASYLSPELGHSMHVSIYWTFIDDAGLTHRDPILRGAIRMIGSSSIVLY